MFTWLPLSTVFQHTCNKALVVSNCSIFCREESCWEDLFLSLHSWCKFLSYRNVQLFFSEKENGKTSLQKFHVLSVDAVLISRCFCLCMSGCIVICSCFIVFILRLDQTVFPGITLSGSSLTFLF